MFINRFYKRLKINAVFCQVINNQSDYDFKSVDLDFVYNTQKIIGVE